MNKVPSSTSQYIAKNINVANNVLYCLISGNKIDLGKDREVNEEDGQSFADSHSMRFLETSAKESDNVDRLFLDIAVELTNNVRNGEIRHDDHEDIIKDTTSVSTCCKG